MPVGVEKAVQALKEACITTLQSLTASQGTSSSTCPQGPEAPERSQDLGSHAYIELAMHWRLVDTIESAILFALTAGEVEETPEGCHTVPRVACPFNCEVLGVVQGICSVDAG